MLFNKGVTDLGVWKILKLVFLSLVSCIFGSRFVMFWDAFRNVLSL